MNDFEEEKKRAVKTFAKRRRIVALVVKEFYQIIRDPSTLMTTFILPVMLIVIYGSGVNLDIKNLKVGLVMEDQSQVAEAFASSLSGSSYFEVERAFNRKEVDYKIVEGALSGMVVVPSYFSRYLEKGKVAPIQVIADGSETNTANFVINYTNGALGNFLQQRSIEGGGEQDVSTIEVDSRFWYNESVESRYFILSGSLAITMTLIGAMLTALVVAREWERGTMESLLTTPVTSFELILGKMLSYFSLGMLSMAICVCVTVFVYGVPLRGSVWVLTLVSAIFLFCSLGMGLMISTLAKNQVLAYQITLIVAFLPAYILSGFLFEIMSMPKWIQVLSSIIPAKYFVQSLQAIFLVGNVWELILYDIAVIAFIGLLFFGVTSLVSVRRLD